MKYIRFVPLLFFIFVSCEPYPVPYFAVYSEDEYFVSSPTEVCYSFNFFYEFSCGDPIQYIRFEIVRHEGTIDVAVYQTYEPVPAPRSGRIWLNNGNNEVDLYQGDYSIYAVLLSDRYGTPEEINSMRASDSFSVVINTP